MLAAISNEWPDPPRRVYRFGSGDRDDLLWEATGQGETAPKEPEAAPEEEKPKVDDDEVPGMRAVRAFFRPRPHTAGGERRLSLQEAVERKATYTYRLHGLDVDEASVPSFAPRSQTDDDSTVPTRPPVVSPILSQLDRRRRSMAGRKLSLVGAQKPEGTAMFTGSRPTSARRFSRGTAQTKVPPPMEAPAFLPASLGQQPKGRRPCSTGPGVCACLNREKAIPQALYAPALLRRPGSARAAQLSSAKQPTDRNQWPGHMEKNIHKDMRVATSLVAGG